MEATTLDTTGAAGLRGPTPLLRLQSDERLVALTRRGNQAAYEALVARYQARLLAFCRHMLGSREDAEDVLQEVFAASYSALLSDDRPINVRPWLYRIARNRSLNHMRKKTAIGVDTMDVHLAEHGTSTADKVHQREEFRLLMGDVQELAETQRTALLLREIDNLSYEQIAEAMDTTVPSVKSLLVRARVGLAEAAEARELTCEDVRIELGEVAEGLKKMSPAVRRHCRTCEQCDAFRGHLKQTNKALAVMLPVAPFIFIKKFVLAHFGTTASASAAAGSVATGAGTASAGGALSATVATVAGKAAAGLAAAAIVTAGAVEVDHVRNAQPARGTPVAEAIAPVVPAPVAVASLPQKTVVAAKRAERPAEPAAPVATTAAATPPATTTTPTVTTPDATTTTPVAPPATDPAAPTGPTETGSDTTVLPSDPGGDGTATTPSEPTEPSVPVAPPTPVDPIQPDPAPPVDESTPPASDSTPAAPRADASAGAPADVIPAG